LVGLRQDDPLVLNVLSLFILGVSYLLVGASFFSLCIARAFQYIINHDLTTSLHRIGVLWSRCERIWITKANREPTLVVFLQQLFMTYLNHMYSMMFLWLLSKFSKADLGATFCNVMTSSRVHVLFSLNVLARSSIISSEDSVRILTGAVTN